MKFSSLKLRGMGSTFPKTAELDIDALKGPLVAICGDIGQGKSVALECLMGAIDRTTPTRGRLGDLATTRDAMVEVVVHNGQPYTIRQTMDSVSGKGESLIMTEDGQPVIKSGKRRDFDKWAAEHFPPANVRMASTFGAQKSEGFIDLKGAARKDVILSIKGCDHLQAMSTQAGDLAREMSREHDSNVERINMLRGGVSAVVIVSEIKDLERDIAASVERVDATTRKVGDARVAIATHKTRLDQHEERTRTRRDLDERVSTKRTELADIREMITNNEHIITEADAIRDAADRKPKLEGEHAALAESTATAQAELTAARDRRTEVRRQKQTQDERVSRTTDDIANAETKIGDWREKMAEAEKQLPIEEEAEGVLALPTDRPSLVVLNKIDLRREEGSRKPIRGALAERTVLEVSALTGDGCDDLARTISGMVRNGKLERSGKGYLLNLRQQQGLQEAGEAVARAGQTLADDIGYEFTALEVRRAVGALSALTRPLDPEDVLERIFAEFCVGK